MREFIEEKLVEHFKKCPVDKYGQMSVMSPYGLFGDKVEEVFEYIKTDKVIKVTTYGGRFGAYKGISPVYDILDEDLRRRCTQAMQKHNKNYEYAMTH
jgi:hypothetical protein